MKTINLMAWLVSAILIIVAVAGMEGAEDKRTEVVHITADSVGQVDAVGQDQLDTLLNSSGMTINVAQTGPDEADSENSSSNGPAVAYNDSGVVALSQGRAQGAVRYLIRALELDSTYARASYNLGIAYQSLNRLDEAIHAYEEAARLRPDYLEPTFNLGCLYTDIENYDDAVRWLTRSTEIVRGDRSAPAHLNLGNIYRRLKDVSKAEASYRKALRYRPGMIEARFNLGLLLKGEERYAQAVEEFERVKALEYQPAKLFRNLGICYSNLDSLVAAEQAYAEWAKLDSADGGAWFNLAIVRGRLGDTLGMIDAYQSALAVDSTHEEAAYNLALLYGKQENINQARAYYRLATTINPSYSKAFYNLALTYSKTEQFDSAAYYYNRVVELDPENTRARFNLGLAYRKSNQVELAAKTYWAIVDIDPTNERAINNLGTAYSELNLHDSALVYFNRLVRLTNEPEAYFNRAKSYHRLDSLEKAKDDYREAIRIKPEYGAALHNLAILEEKSGDLNEAVRLLEEAIKYDNKNWKRHWKLGQVYLKLGRNAKAREAYTAAAALKPSSAKFQHELDSIMGN